MEKIELLEKLVEVQEMHIVLMQDFANLQGSLKSLEEIKNRRIDDLNNTIEALELENAELKKQIEILQQALVTVETPEENQ